MSTISSAYSQRTRAVRKNEATSSNEIKLMERVDLEMGELVLRNRSAIEASRRRRQNQGSGKEFDANDMPKEDEELIDWNKIRTTLDCASVMDGVLPVEYRLNERSEGHGRMNAKVDVSVSNAIGKGTNHPIPYVYMVREVRAALAAKYYWDVDFANCQPAILKQRLEKAGIACVNLARYVNSRAECLKEVQETCKVDRDAAKQLFLRITYGGSAVSWMKDVKTAIHPPAFVTDMGNEIIQCGAMLMEREEMADLRDYHKRNFDCSKQRTIASQLAIHIQTLEADCVRSLVRAVIASRREVGGIIYDGVHVEKLPGDEATGPPEELLCQWQSRVNLDTGYTLALTQKPFDILPELLEAAKKAEPPSRNERGEDPLSWMTSNRLLTYDAMRKLWEKHTFKVIRDGNYCVEERSSAGELIRTTYNCRGLEESYKHLHYLTKVSPSEIKRRSFISQWTQDDKIRAYREVALLPPPTVHNSITVYNLWTDFHAAKEPPGLDGYDANAATDLFESFVLTLCDNDAAVQKYVLDWLAQMFQQPAVKIGTALLLKGEEGTGKNRLTDLIGNMVGDAKFLQTANPATSLYGRFTQLREGRVFIVINEASGADSFAKNDIIKDMITCSDFVCEGKNTNAYKINCYARFIFTTNNMNAIKLTPSERRFAVIETSSELKGNTDYFKKLSDYMADPRACHAFYLRLMSRDISKVDWINDRPITAYYATMVQLSLPAEYRFLKTILIDAYAQHARNYVKENCILKKALTVLFDEFRIWLVESHTKSNYETSAEKFGLLITELIAKPTKPSTSSASSTLDELGASTSRGVGNKVSAMQGVSKARASKGIVYSFNLDVVVPEMLRLRWVTPDDLPPSSIINFPVSQP